MKDSLWSNLRDALDPIIRKFAVFPERLLPFVTVYVITSVL